MKKKVFFTSVLLLFLLMAKSQILEPGLFAGATYYLGDINPGKHFDQSILSTGAILRYYQNDRWVFRANLLLGKVQGADTIQNVVENRELAFTSKIIEISGVVEFNFFPFDQYVLSSFRYSPYIFVGIGVFFFQPKYGEYNLRDYGTEGQLDQSIFPERSPYALSGLSIPFGIGIKYRITDKVVVSLEWGMRKTFTDYIDDISKTYYLNPATFTGDPVDLELSDPTQTHLPYTERGNPATNDWYNFYGITLTYKINIKKSYCIGY